MAGWPGRGVPRRVGQWVLVPPFGSVFTQRPFGELHLYAIGRVGVENVHDALVGLATGPVLLQFEHCLEGRHGHRTGLDGRWIRNVHGS